MSKSNTEIVLKALPALAKWTGLTEQEIAHEIAKGAGF